MRTRLFAVAAIAAASTLALSSCAGESDPEESDTSASAEADAADPTETSPGGQTPDPSPTESATVSTEADEGVVDGDFVLPECGELVPADELDALAPGAVLRGGPTPTDIWASLGVDDSTHVTGSGLCLWMSDDLSSGLAVTGAIMDEDGIATVEEGITTLGPVTESTIGDATVYASDDSDGEGGVLVIDGDLAVLVAGTVSSADLDDLTESVYEMISAANS